MVIEFHGQWVACSDTKPVKPAPKTLSHCPKTKPAASILFCTNFEVAQCKGLHAKALAKLVVSFVVTSDRIPREEFGTHLKMEPNFAF